MEEARMQGAALRAKVDALVKSRKGIKRVAYETQNTRKMAIATARHAHSWHDGGTG